MRKYIYPKGLICGYFLESMANNGVGYSLKRGNGSYIRYLKDCKDEIVDLFGGAIRVSPDSIADLERAQEELQKKQQTELFYID